MATRRGRERALTAAMVLAGCALLAGCSSGGSDDDSATTTSASSSTTTTSSTPATTRGAAGNVAQAQNQLNALGCDAGTADGELGPQTVAAIKRFQSAAGIAQDGALGSATAAKLSQAAQSGSPRCAATPSSSTPAASDDQSKIIAAVSAFQASQGAQPNTFQVNNIKISSIDPQWAGATVAPTPGQPVFQPDRALVRRSGSGWMWIAEGTSGVGCESGLPDNVRDELDIPGGC